MAAICCGVVGETDTSATVEPSSRAAKRRRMEMHQFKFLPSDVADTPPENGRKRQKLKVFLSAASPPRECDNAVDNCAMSEGRLDENGGSETKSANRCASPTSTLGIELEVVEEFPKFGMTSVCGRRREMEDAVAIHPSFCRRNRQTSAGLHFFGVYDGHGGSNVAMECKDRLHEIVRDELENGEEAAWKEIMERSFSRMDKEVDDWCSAARVSSSNWRCALQTPKCDAVGSTAVVAVVTPEKIIVSNCGDSRAVLCRNGVAIPLSIDQKPDRPDELNRIESAGGQVIYWDGPRVVGVLAMSRAIGDSYLKPFVISEPEVTVTERTAEDECLILASDGLWDVVTNDTACGVARMCLRSEEAAGESSKKACSDASILLTKLALARHSTDNLTIARGREIQRF